jgi:ubiquitin C-terminal hydrolase
MIGLQNLGNTCYINAVLQCFLNDPFFTKNVKNKYFSPIHLYTFIEYFFSEKTHLKIFEQNDAHEFLVEFLDLLCLTSKKTIKSEGLSNPDELWNNFLLKNNNLLTSIYHGQLKTSIKCSKCENISRRYEEFNTINLMIKDSLVDSLIDYLKLEDINNYYCEHCKCETPAKKKVVIHRIPERLIIVNSSRNNFLIDNLLLIKNHNELFNYKLASTVNYHGNAESGHYTSNVLMDDKWYLMDDLIVEQTPFNADGVYILFFHKV